MSPSLPASLLAKLSPTCRRCPRDRAPDSDYCAECEPRQRGYVRAAKAKARRDRRAAHQCIDCGNQLPRTWDGSRCKQCRRVQSTRRRVKRKARHVKQRRDLPVAQTPARGHYKTEVSADGAERTRYVGQSHRGGPTRQEQDASLRRLALDARRLLDGFLAVFPEERPQIDALPRIQRAEAWALVTSSGTRSARLLLGVMADLGDATAREVLRMLDAE